MKPAPPVTIARTRPRILDPVPGTFVAIEGIDGSGKGTQAALLVEAAREAGLSTALISFPLYDDNPFSVAVADYLNGAFGTVDQVHPELSGLLYACDRFHARPALERALAENDLVVCDRYVPSNLAHQGAKLAGAERERLLEWLVSVEYGEFGLPRPDLVVLLDLPAALARALVERKPVREYTTLTADIHEEAGDHLASAREVYLELARRDPGSWHTVAVAGPDGVRSVEAVAADVWSAVSLVLGGRSRS
jgi:dTMP kinase